MILYWWRCNGERKERYWRSQKKETKPEEKDVLTDSNIYDASFIVDDGTEKEKKDTEDAKKEETKPKEKNGLQYPDICDASFIVDDGTEKEQKYTEDTKKEETKPEEKNVLQDPDICDSSFIVDDRTEKEEIRAFLKILLSTIHPIFETSLSLDYSRKKWALIPVKL